MPINRNEVIWAYRSILGREPDNEDVIEAQCRDHQCFSSLRSSLISSLEFNIQMSQIKIKSDQYFRYKRNDDRPIILVQNYHAPATMAIIRDLTKIGLRVVCPDSNWNFTLYASNEGLGGELISYDDFMNISPCRILIGCLPQEGDLKRLARRRGDRIVLHVAQHNNFYEPGLGDVLICPDIVTYENYPSEIKHKLLYFSKPHLDYQADKDIEACFQDKVVSSFVSMPQYWPAGTLHLDEFAKKYPNKTQRFGIGAADGILSHAACNETMSRCFLTVHFKDLEAYGLACLESMMLGTPVISLKSLMQNRTLGRYFLDESNSICAESVDQAIEKVLSLSIDRYREMSRNCVARVLELTSERNTVDRLRQAIFD